LTVDRAPNPGSLPITPAEIKTLCFEQISWRQNCLASQAKVEGFHTLVIGQFFTSGVEHPQIFILNDHTDE